MLRCKGCDFHVSGLPVKCTSKDIVPCTYMHTSIHEAFACVTFTQPPQRASLLKQHQAR